MRLTNAKYTLEEQICKANIHDETGSFDFSDEFVDHEAQQGDVEYSE